MAFPTPPDAWILVRSHQDLKRANVSLWELEDQKGNRFEAEIERKDRKLWLLLDPKNPVECMWRMQGPTTLAWVVKYPPKESIEEANSGLVPKPDAADCVWYWSGKKCVVQVQKGHCTKKHVRTLAKELASKKTVPTPTQSDCMWFWTGVKCPYGDQCMWKHERSRSKP